MALARRCDRRHRRAHRRAPAAEAARARAARGRGARPGGELMPRWLRLAIVVAISALVVVLVLAFRRSPQDLRTGTVGKPAAAFSLQKLDGSGALTVAPTDGKGAVVHFFPPWRIPGNEWE